MQATCTSFTAKLAETTVNQTNIVHSQTRHLAKEPLWEAQDFMTDMDL